MDRAHAPNDVPGHQRYTTMRDSAPTLDIDSWPLRSARVPGTWWIVWVYWLRLVVLDRSMAVL